MSKHSMNCCIGCGRDTRGVYCPACRPHSPGRYPSNRDGERGRRRLDGAWPEQVFDADRFDDESGPDDIFDDGGTEAVRWRRS